MKRSLLVCPLVAVGLLLSTQAQASTISYDLDYAFSGSVPGSTSPYATVTFLDGSDCLGGACASGTVQMILSASLEASSEFITEWDFNSSADVTVSYVSGTGAFTAPTVLPYSSNTYKADGDGYYDLSVLFDASGSGSSTTRFNGTDTATFLITGSSIDVNTFAVLSSPTDSKGHGGSGSGPFYTAAHLQGIAPSCSGWISDGNGLSGAAPGVTGCSSVPDSGATVGLLGLALLGVGYLRSKLA